jgi:hypothetical protein
MGTMQFRGWSVLVTFTVIAILALPEWVQAQDKPQPLTLPTVMFGAAALSDWATTYHALKNYHVREANPLLRPFDGEPARMVTLGAAIDVGLAASWNYSVGRNNPRLAAAGLWAMTAFRAYLALHNMQNVKRSVRR